MRVRWEGADYRMSVHKRGCRSPWTEPVYARWYDSNSIEEPTLPTLKNIIMSNFARGLAIQCTCL